MAQYSLTFLPFLKRQPPLPIDDSKPGHLTATLDLKIIDNTNNEHPVGSRALTLRGPGDILGISQNMIARLEPPPRTHDFEPNYFPFLEFVDPDFPWRYSLDNVVATSRKAHPWLSLIVLSTEEIDEMMKAGIEVITLLGDRREFLSVRGKYLPNLEEAWATAHVQLNNLQKPIAEFIESNPASHCSRLFCFRRLAPQKNYLAFLVPDYKIAVQAAFGLGQDGMGNEQAWVNPADGDILKLPMYFSWSFTTSEAGDFEQLARNLKPTALDPEQAGKIGTRAIDANPMAPHAAPKFDRFFLREGALAAPGFSAVREPYPQHSRPLPLTIPMLRSLNESLKSAEEPLTDQSEDDVDPLITLPVYGRYFRKTSEIKAPENDQWPGPTPWVHELNLDFRNRVAAAFGTTVVQKNQDEFMKACWAQYGEIRKANEKIRLTKAAYLVSKTLETKHLQPLPDERFTLLSTPFHAHFAMSAQGKSVSIKQALADSGISPGIFSPTFRRVAQRQIGIKRVQPARAIELAKTGFHPRPLQPRKFSLPTTPDVLGAILNKLPGAEVEALAPKKEIIPVQPVDFSTDFREKFDIGHVLRGKLSGVIVPNDGSPLPENFDLIMAHPQIDASMYSPLKNLSQDYLLPGIENIAHNGVTLCEENRRFIEAYMVGLNHEMGRELVWRNYPTDQRGTVFSYFWDRVIAGNPPPDIKEIHQWTNLLGSNQNTAIQEANLVLVIKGDLIRRYPGTIVYALKIPGKGNYWSKGYPKDTPPMDAAHKIEPVLRAQVGADILCVGFPFSLKNVHGATRDGEYYFIVQENQDLPRFGLDVASERIKEAPGCGGQEIDINELSWSDVTLDDAGYITHFEQPFADGAASPPTSATIALKTYQLPIRVAIHSSELLPGGETS